jgi:hypothetical protein
MASTKAPIRVASLLFSGGLCLVLMLHWQLWTQLPLVLAQDTLWDLSLGARVMLVALSTCAVVATALCCLVKLIWIERNFYDRASFSPVRWIGVFVLDVSTTLVMLWGAISLAPQLFYTLYVVVITELFAQWVAKPVDLATLSEILLLTPVDSMATLLIGVMMLSILVASIIFWLSVAAKLFHSEQ